MIKAGTPKERVVEILKASGVRVGDWLAYRTTDTAEYFLMAIGTYGLREGFDASRDYYYATRVEKYAPRRIELVEPKEKTLEEKMTEGIHQRGNPWDSPAAWARICAKVAEEHFAPKLRRSILEGRRENDPIFST